MDPSNTIVWINGAFGSGKTSTALRLQELIPGSTIFDPEFLGFALRDGAQPPPKGDFQQLPLWRQLVWISLQSLAATSVKPVIVPMTIVDHEIFAETVGRLRDEGVNVRHFSLVAGAATLTQRLSNRPIEYQTWPLEQIDRCVKALKDPVFAEHVDTDLLPLEDVAQHILSKCISTAEPTGR